MRRIAWALLALTAGLTAGCGNDTADNAPSEPAVSVADEAADAVAKEASAPAEAAVDLDAMLAEADLDRGRRVVYSMPGVPWPGG